MQVGLFINLISEYEKLEIRINDVVDEENMDLFKRLLLLQNKKYEKYSKKIINISRIQGIITKVLLREKLFINKNELKEFIDVYGEIIIEVEDDSDEKKLLLNALNTKITDIINVYFKIDTATYIVKVDKRVADRIYGHLWSNVRTAEKIINKKIKIEVG